MSRTGPRYTTAFDNDTTNAIEKEIKKMAMNINRHIALSDVKIRDLRDVVIAPELREIASDTAKHYIGHLSADAFQAPIVWPRAPLNENDVTTQFGGDDTRVFFSFLTSDAAFVVPRAMHQHPAQMYDDANPELMARIEKCVQEWAANAIRWAFVLDVFTWVNSWVGKGERDQARLLLPGILGLLRRADLFELAARLTKPTSMGVRRPVPPDLGAGALQRANEIIAGGLLYSPKLYERAPGCAIMRIETKNRSLYPLWHRDLEPIVGLS